MSLDAAPLDAYLGVSSLPEVELKRIFGRDDSLTIFDVGACEGEESIRYARAFPRARIYAFEPLPANLPLINENLRRYAVPNVELVPTAVSDSIGEATFHVSSGRPRELYRGEIWNYGNKSSSLLPPKDKIPIYGWIEFSEQTKVPCLTLDSFCRERGISEIHFLHLDVQGAERLVLAGAEATLPQIRIIWLEVANSAIYLGQTLRQEMEMHLVASGFILAHYEDHGTEGDALFVNRRFWSGRIYIARILLHRLVRVIRGLLGNAKRKILPKPQT
ncbi:hypothetical protein AYO41_04050 [Verrucomicrobia bacterium SCGC AG-212-E04]|nr:hypothetical protein AYO41_04050 [Verrucomicrobia bacterium SCGC AG-212-E04]